MQKLTVEELKRLLYDTFCDHLSMKDIENIIMTEENHIENPEDCQVDIDSKKEPPTPQLKGLRFFVLCKIISTPSSLTAAPRYRLTFDMNTDTHVLGGSVGRLTHV